MTPAIAQMLDQTMPNWRSIVAEPNWARWLAACNPADGRLRSEQFNDAVRRGDAGQVIAMLQRYLQEQREGWPIREAGRGPPRQPARHLRARRFSGTIASTSEVRGLVGRPTGIGWRRRWPERSRMGLCQGAYRP
jgi:hypothetical protein